MSNNLRDVPITKSIEELSQYDKILRQTCKDVINNKDYDDIVNQTYLKIDKYYKRGKIINSGYIFIIMKTINIDMINSTNKTEELLDIVDSILIEQDASNKLVEVYKIMDELLSPEDKEFFIYTTENSQRKAVIKYGIKLWKVKKKMKIIRNTLDPYIKKLKE
jgi:hypothetical protein